MRFVVSFLYMFLVAGTGVHSAPGMESDVNGEHTGPQDGVSTYGSNGKVQDQQPNGELQYRRRKEMTSERIGGGRPKLSYFTHRFHPQFIDFFQALLKGEDSKSPISDGETKGGASSPYGTKQTVSLVGHEEEAPEPKADEADSNEYSDDRSSEDHNDQNYFQEVIIEDIHNNNDPSQRIDKLFTEPSHLACISRTEEERIPDSEEPALSREYGLGTEAYTALMDYIAGNNSLGKVLPLMYPITIQVRPNADSTVTRSMCIIINKFNSKIPAAMENHLRIIELAAPVNDEIQLRTVGTELRYTRQYTGRANDYMYRMQAKQIMDAIIERRMHRTVDLHSYFISINEELGHFNYSIGFLSKHL